MSIRKVRTRIAPSPTGFLHLGTARTALFSWAYARHHGGEFILRIEDTDVARNTQESVDQIIAAMQWLGLHYDEGPYYQMQRLGRYKAVIEQMLADGTAYFCYCTPQELDAMRERQRAAGENIRYDGTWRPEPGKTLPPVPAGVKPVVRFKNPLDGAVTWNDLVKGPITFSNRELDDLIIARPAEAEGELIGIPTYNFCVVVDDWDMRITHVFRGDEHVNNTPRQINIFRALGAPLPEFGHVPIILGDDGLKLSKRRGAVSVMEYADRGYLPEAMVNYLARLGWSHGDDELFTREQLVQWFDGTHLAQSPAQWDGKKLDWVNAHYLKSLDDAELLQRIRARKLLGTDVAPHDAPRALQAIGLFKDRCATLVELCDWLHLVLTPVHPDEAQIRREVPESVWPAVLALADRLEALPAWDEPAIAEAFKQALKEQGLKMPQLAMPVRMLVTGQTQTPSITALLAVMERNDALARLMRLRTL
jgi:glutamyl-tRNA synthetase